MKKSFTIYYLLIISFTLSGCNYTRVKEIPDSPSGVQVGSSVSYSMINETIIKPQCISCHGGRIPPLLISYSDVKTNLEAVRSAVIVRRVMPKSGPLKDSDIELLSKWITEGAPEVATQPLPSPSPSPLVDPNNRPVVHWEELRAQVLISKCINCHYKQNPDKISNLDDLENFRGTIGTTLYVSLINPAMPPAPKGTPEGAPNPNELNRKEKEMLSNWVVDGMQP